MAAFVGPGPCGNGRGRWSKSGPAACREGHEPWDGRPPTCREACDRRLDRDASSDDTPLDP